MTWKHFTRSEFSCKGANWCSDIASRSFEACNAGEK